MKTTAFKAHVHRLNLHVAGMPKWYVHLDVWGPDPRAFKRIDFYVPTTTAEGGLADAPAPSCGCANAWIAGEVPEGEIYVKEGGTVLVLGKPPKAKRR